MILVFTSFVILGSVMMATFFQYAKSDKQKLLTQSAVSMSSITTAVDLTNSDAQPVLTLFAQSFSKNIDADIFVTNLDGGVIFGAYANSTDSAGTRFTPPDSIPAEIAQEAASGTYSGMGKKNGVYPGKYYVVGVPLRSPNDPDTIVGAVFAAANYSTVTEYQFAAFQMFLIAAAASFVLSFCIVGIFVYRMVKPLRQMSAAARSFGNGDFSVRVPVTSHDEVGQLAASFSHIGNL